MPARNKKPSHSKPFLTLFVTLGLSLFASCGSTDGNRQDTIDSRRRPARPGACHQSFWDGLAPKIQYGRAIGKSVYPLRLSF